MIEIVNPGWLSLMVDRGRVGFADIGVPSSSALDRYAFDAANYLTGSEADAPVLEVIGSGFAFMAHGDISCAVTGARVEVSVNDNPVPPWTCFEIPRGGAVTVKEVREGFRYYVSFSGAVVTEEIMGSRSTNLECGFGGFRGRPLMKGDFLDFKDIRPCDTFGLPEEKIPVMAAPHLLRIVEGPETGCFTRESRERSLSGEDGENFIVSARLNRAAIRLEGKPLVFKRGAERSIVSEGILPGTVQIPGDGQPIITLYERTIGGYARLGVVTAADRNLLAHLKPGDRVRFKLITLDEARKLRRFPSFRNT
jgi:biotin-dependent carboxylase-like uncharacterized protein